MLEIKGIHSYYGKSHILHGVSLNLQEGEMVCLLGRNGVGKSTTLKSIMGVVRPQQGSIRFRDQELVGLAPYEIARCGVGYVPEDRRIFRSLTVHENLLMGIKAGKKANGGENWTIEKIYELFPRLQERCNNKGSHLSGGEQQMLTVVRTLMGNPKVILVDEPTEGLAPLIVTQILELVKRLAEESNLAVLLVEQNAVTALRVAHSAVVLNLGQVVMSGSAADIASHEELRHAYLGY